MGLFGKFKAPKRHVAVWDPALQQFELKWMVAENYNVVEDRFLKKAYEIGPGVRAVTFKNKNKVIARVPIVDESTGTGVNLEYDEGILNVRTNPDLLGHMIDATMIKNAYGLTPSMKTVIIFSLVAFIMGLLFGNGMG